MPVATSAHEFDFAASGRGSPPPGPGGLAAIGERIDGAFSDACRRILGCQGRVVGALNIHDLLRARVV